MNLAPLRALFVALRELADEPEALRRVLDVALAGGDDVPRLEVAVPEAPPSAPGRSTSKDAARMRARRAAEKAARAANAFANAPERVRDQAEQFANMFAVSRALLSLFSSEIFESYKREHFSTGDAREGERTPNVRGEPNANERTEPPSGVRPVAERLNAGASVAHVAPVTSGVPGVGVSNEVRPPAPPSNPGVENATADGAGGYLVSAWTEGVSAATGFPYPEPRGKTAGRVGVCLRRMCPGGDEVKAKELGARWARSSAKPTLNALDFDVWVGSGMKDERAAKGDQTEPPEAVAARRRAEENEAARKARDHRKQQREALPPAIGAAQLLAAITPKRPTSEEKAG